MSSIQLWLVTYLLSEIIEPWISFKFEEEDNAFICCTQILSHTTVNTRTPSLKTGVGAVEKGANNIKTTIFPGLLTGHDLTRRSDQEVLKKSRVGSGRVRPGQELFKFSRIGPGHRYLIWPDLTRQVDPTL